MAGEDDVDMHALWLDLARFAAWSSAAASFVEAPAPSPAGAGSGARPALTASELVSTYGVGAVLYILRFKKVDTQAGRAGSGLRTRSRRRRSPQAHSQRRRCCRRRRRHSRVPCTSSAAT